MDSQDYFPPLPPLPPLPPPGVEIIYRFHRLTSPPLSYYVVSILLAQLILLGMSLHHVRMSVWKRLWLFSCHPARLLALNAGTLGLLGIAAKLPNGLADEFSTLLGSVLICAVMGACMPSAATADLTHMWSNIAGVGLLVSTTVVNIFWHVYKHDFQYTVFQNLAAAVCMVMLLAVLLTNAIALEAMMSDVRAMVSQQLDELHMEVRPGYKVNLMVERPWGWDVLERDSCIKLMILVTSHPQNVAARSPTTAIVGALVLFSMSILKSGMSRMSGISQVLYTDLVVFPIILVCGFICVWRWLRVALHEDRPFVSLVLDAEPSYWRRTVNDFRLKLKAGPPAQPNVLEEGQYSFKEVLHYTAAFLLLCSLVPIHRLLLAVIKLVYLLSVVLMRVLISPIKALARICLRWLLGRQTDSKSILELAGVVCLAGEGARIVRQEFEGAVKLVSWRQIKKGETSTDMDALVTLLRASSAACNFKNSSIIEVLDHGGAPVHVDLHVEHGYQYGWNLTAVSLLAAMTKIEVEALGTSQTSEEAMNAYWQALEMVKVVDEQYPPIVSSKETYLSASASVWSKLLKKKRRWLNGNLASPAKDPAEVLKALMRSAESQIDEFNKTNAGAAPWPMQMVASYTMHTVCKNLLRWWTDPESDNRAAAAAAEESRAGALTAMVEHTNFLMAEVVAGCLSNLPVALNISMTEAVRGGQAAKIEAGLFVVGQGKQLWEKMQWPTPRPTETGLGQLSQWLH